MPERHSAVVAHIRHSAQDCGYRTRGPALSLTLTLTPTVTPTLTLTPTLFLTPTLTPTATPTPTLTLIRYTRDDVTLNWLPFDHVVPLLTFHMADVYLGRAAVQLPTSEVIEHPYPNPSPDRIPTPNP